MNMGEILSGKTLAQKLRSEIKDYVSELKVSGKRVPCITTILLGNDGGSVYYVNNQKKLCEDLGMTMNTLFLEDSLEEEELIGIIDKLNNDEMVDAIMLQLPLPKHIDEKKVVSRIDYRKDIDGLTEINTGRFYLGENCFVPCTAMSVLELIKSTNVNLQGKHAVVIGRSNIVGKPVAQLLLNENCTVTICHSRTTNLKEICSSADILVCAIGKPGFIDKEYVKEGAIVIDVGTSNLNGKITGDVCFDSVVEKAAFVTPVPGGVGAVTTTLLMRNTCKALERYVY
jgi:methylenetetrahydrofolate dehydrogenase (NADP+)/methenyltetrahydrofolate cyclohydrolase